MMALIGCLVLVGIVVNNGIDIDILRNRDGYSLVDAITAAASRLRSSWQTRS